MNKTKLIFLVFLLSPLIGFSQAKTEIKKCKTILATYNGLFDTISSFEFILEKKIAPETWLKVATQSSTTEQVEFTVNDEGVYRTTVMLLMKNTKFKEGTFISPYTIENKLVVNANGFKSNEVSISNNTNPCDQIFLNDIKTETKKPFAIYPNPASNKLNIQLIGGEIDCDISIYNINGQALLHSSTYKSEIDLTSLVSGVYLIEILIGDSKFIEKLTVTK